MTLMAAHILASQQMRVEGVFPCFRINAILKEVGFGGMGNCMSDNGRRVIAYYVMVGSLGLGCVSVCFLKRLYSKSNKLIRGPKPKPAKDDDVRNYLAAHNPILFTLESLHARHTSDDFKAAKSQSRNSSQR
ncbi:hypothetical protein PIB30_045913 [Stylosanthes scabra]|uniref:Uncharacterized protein n=1 Tax=Stylosanthes scabra TaxID=79078 RepID=A0ABU6WEP6_9FABA|nr:hypothetical protein [Stylosanthes scabra]